MTYDRDRDGHVRIVDTATGLDVPDVVTYDDATMTYVQYLAADGGYVYDRFGNRRTRTRRGRLIVFRVEADVP